MPRHTVEIPDIIYAWAQKKSGKTNAQPWIRNNILWPAMIADVGGSTVEEDPTLDFKETTEDKWDKIGMGVNPLDSDFTKARSEFIHRYGRGEDKAIEFFENSGKRGIHDPRAWLMSWWHDQKPQAI